MISTVRGHSFHASWLLLIGANVISLNVWNVLMDGLACFLQMHVSSWTILSVREVETRGLQGGMEETKYVLWLFCVFSQHVHCISF